MKIVSKCCLKRETKRNFRLVNPFLHIKVLSKWKFFAALLPCILWSAAWTDIIFRLIPQLMDSRKAMALGYQLGLRGMLSWVQRGELQFRWEALKLITKNLTWWLTSMTARMKNVFCWVMNQELTVTMSRVHTAWYYSDFWEGSCITLLKVIA